MNVLATKNTAAGIIYLPVAVVGVIIVAIGSTSLAAIYAWPVGALIAGIGIYHFKIGVCAAFKQRILVIEEIIQHGYTAAF